MSIFRRKPSSRDAIMQRLDQAVIEQRRITAQLRDALDDQRVADVNLDRAVNELRRQRPDA